MTQDSEDGFSKQGVQLVIKSTYGSVGKKAFPCIINGFLNGFV